ncbi:MAG: hypothetical protein GY812_15195 [Actinomycetia bacterium]|nr:hypothetical protein [Actinomycetes bacterium]
MVAMIAIAVGLQAQRVVGQDALEAVRADMSEESRRQSELRAQVAEAEAPSQILESAADIGMIEPAAVVAVPSSAVVSPVDPANAAAEERG